MTKQADIMVALTEIRHLRKALETIAVPPHKRRWWDKRADELRTVARRALIPHHICGYTGLTAAGCHTCRLNAMLEGHV